MRMDLPFLKTMTQAGGKLNKDLAKEYIEWAQSKGKRFFVMYGQTEATARMSYLPLEHALDKYASILSFPIIIIKFKYFLIILNFIIINFRIFFIFVPNNIINISS